MFFVREDKRSLLFSSPTSRDVSLCSLAFTPFGKHYQVPRFSGLLVPGCASSCRAVLCALIFHTHQRSPRVLSFRAQIHTRQKNHECSRKATLTTDTTQFRAVCSIIPRKHRQMNRRFASQSCTPSCSGLLQSLQYLEGRSFKSMFWRSTNEFFLSPPRQSAVPSNGYVSARVQAPPRSGRFSAMPSAR